MGKKATNTDEINPALRRLVTGASGERSQPVAQESTTPGAQAERAGRSEPTIEKRSLDAPRRGSRVEASNALTVNRKVMFSEAEAQRNAKLTELVSSCFGGTVTYSQVSRVMWSVLAGAEGAVREGAKRQPRRTFPSKGNAVAMAEYEDALADFLATAMKRA